MALRSSGISSTRPGEGPLPARGILGWDVGGANVKAARLDSASTAPTPTTVERPFPLWREPRALPGILHEISEDLGGATARMGVTMTAELADCFPTKREGVIAVLESFRTAFPESDVRVFGVDGAFRTIPQALDAPLVVAAANWMATATVVAREVPDVLVIDCGSTTTDIIPVVDGRVVARGRSDPERLAFGELVYTGIQRTPVCAVLNSVTVGGRSYRVAAEVFAVAADAHRWLGILDEDSYTSPTPDGGGRSRVDAGRRLARMICADLDMLSEEDVSRIAHAVVERQVGAIAGGIRQVRDGLGPRAPGAAAVLGSGRTLAERAVGHQRLQILSGDARPVPDGPAAAVAMLLSGAGPGPRGDARLVV